MYSVHYIQQFIVTRAWGGRGPISKNIDTEKWGGAVVFFFSDFLIFKGRSRWLRPKAHILDDPLGNPYDGLKVAFGPPYGPSGSANDPYGPIMLQKK